MATRGDLLITVERDYRVETNRFFISSDAYLDDAGMHGRIKNAFSYADEKDISFTNALISLYPEYIHLQNNDRDGGSTYEIDLVENTIKFGYKYNNSSEDWCILSSINDFVSSTKREKDYINDYNNFKEVSW